MSPAYAPHAAWISIWANPKYATGAAPLVLPVGDALDGTSLSVLNFNTATWQDLEPVASRAHATEAFLVQVSQGKGTLDIKLKRLGLGNSPPMPDVVVPITPGTVWIEALCQCRRRGRERYHRRMEGVVRQSISANATS